MMATGARFSENGRGGGSGRERERKSFGEKEWRGGKVRPRGKFLFWRFCCDRSGCAIRAKSVLV